MDGTAAEQKAKGALAVNGVRDSGMLLPFSYGSTKITAGRGITPEDAGGDVAVIEQRLADANHLKVGDTVRVRSADGASRTTAVMVGTFAGLIVWVIALAGALTLGLIVTLQIRERRTELGVLLAMGEKKWKLIGQHAVEVAAVALPAVALAALAGSLAGRPAGEAFLGHQGDKPASMAARAPDTGIDPPAVRVEPADVGKVAGIGLGISLVSTVIPGIGILRLHPRSILTDSE